MDSLWTETTELPKFQALRGNLQTDVLIIGGGIAGLLCAKLLAEAGVEYALIEAQRICGGITKNTTAKITVQHGLVYDKMIRRFGLEAAKRYLDGNQTAADCYRKMCRGIDCGFEEKDAYVYSLDNKKKIEKELNAMQKLGVEAGFAERLPLPFPVAGAVVLHRQAQFHPLKFLASVSSGLSIYEDTKALELGKNEVITNRGIIRAKRIIVATHFPLLNKHGSYFLKLYQHRSYVIALEGGPDVQGMYVDESETGMSFRNAGGLLLVGGGGHRTGKQGGNWQELESFARQHYPDARERYRWATQDCMSLDGVPYIGPYSAGTPNLYVATGFNKWGITTSMLAAMILTDMICGRENPYARAFSPSRSILRPQLALNAFEAAVNMLTPSTKRCPHLGCALKWNPQERTWDCPCHGSRFAENGRVIDNPATGNWRGAHHE